LTADFIISPGLLAIVVRLTAQIASTLVRRYKPAIAVSDHNCLNATLILSYKQELKVGMTATKMTAL